MISCCGKRTCVFFFILFSRIALGADVTYSPTPRATMEWIELYPSQLESKCAAVQRQKSSKCNKLKRMQSEIDENEMMIDDAPKLHISKSSFLWSLTRRGDGRILLRACESGVGFCNDITIKRV